MSLKERVYSHLPTMTIEEYQKYLNEEELGYININKHLEDENVVILNYTELATYEKRWNKETSSARGLILDLTEARDNGIIYVLARPFGKFPNYSENPEYEEDIDMNDIDYVMEKMDGSLGISYFFKDSIRFATRGSFHSDQALMATELWNEKHAKHEGEDLKVYASCPVTYLVEIIYPENRIVVNYGGDRKLVLLGINYLFADYDASHSDLVWEADILKMEVAPRYEYTIEELLELKKTLSPNEEGWVVRFGNGKRLKIKGDEYINVHRIMHGLSDKAKVQAWQEGRMQDYIKALPEEFRPELETFADDLDRLKDSLYTLLQTLFEIISKEATDRKSFALKVNAVVSQEFRHFMFSALKNGSVSVEDIRYYIFKNYSEYLEVIRGWNN